MDDNGISDADLTPHERRELRVFLQERHHLHWFIAGLRTIGIWIGIVLGAATAVLIALRGGVKWLMGN